MKTYKLEVTHDTGTTIFETVASDLQSAKDQICKAESCPESAIKHTWQIANGTAYDGRTGDAIIKALEFAKANHIRVWIETGDPETGKGWGDTCDVTGTIGRSNGTIKIPILLHNARSMGGGAILDHCIVSIQYAKGKQFIYRHPKYKTGR